MESDYRDTRLNLDRRNESDRRKFDDSDYSGIERRISVDRRSRDDKRQSPRFRVKSLVFAKFHSKCREDIGKLLDVSRGGVALRYAVKGAIPADYDLFDIFLPEDDFIIPHIPFTTVSNVALSGKAAVSPIVLRRYGVQFKDLTIEQQSKLDHFLENYTLGEA